jgi:hypothetical protein
LPLHGGLSEVKIARPLNLQPRLLNGSVGGAGEFEFEWDALKINSPHFPYGAVGGMFAVGSLDKRRGDLLTSDWNNLYSISTILQGYYAFDYLFDEQKQNLNVHLGISFHRVSRSKVDGDQIVKAGDPEDFVDPLIRVEYKNQRIDWFKLTGQFSRLLMLTAWAELVPYFMYAEVKYSRVVFSDRKPWEHDYYVYGTIGFNFDF